MQENLLKHFKDVQIASFLCYLIYNRDDYNMVNIPYRNVENDTGIGQKKQISIIKKRCRSIHREGFIL